MLSTQFDFFLPSHDYFMFVHIDTLNMYNVYKMNYAFHCVFLDPKKEKKKKKRTSNSNEDFIL
jgi:hypothetical protein